MQKQQNIFYSSICRVLSIIVLQLFFVLFADSQNIKLTLKPTEKKALVNVIVRDFTNSARADELILFASTKTKGVYRRISDEEGKCTFLLPKGDTYTIKYEEFGSIVEYSKLKVTADSGLYMLLVNIRFENKMIQPLNNVQFETNKAILTSQSYKELTRLYDIMQRKTKVVIEIAGHTDNVGNSDDNLKLSQKRADAVREYLIKKGLPEYRVFAKGYGDTDPVDDNFTADGRRNNRRAEVRILKE